MQRDLDDGDPPMPRDLDGGFQPYAEIHFDLSHKEVTYGRMCVNAISYSQDIKAARSCRAAERQGTTKLCPPINTAPARKHGRPPARELERNVVSHAREILTCHPAPARKLERPHHDS